MIVVDDEPWKWCLYEEEDHLYLVAHCSHSAVDYNFTIELNIEERSDYERLGRSYLDHLAHEIHFSAPGVKGNHSIYRNRRVSDSVDRRIRKV